MIHLVYLMSIFELSVYDDASIPQLPVFFRRAIVDELWTVLRFLRIPTFSVMIVQGIFGGMPWTIMGCLGCLALLGPAKAGGLLCGLLATWYYMAVLHGGIVVGLGCICHQALKKKDLQDI